MLTAIYSLIIFAIYMEITDWFGWWDDPPHEPDPLEQLEEKEADRNE